MKTAPGLSSCWNQWSQQLKVFTLLILTVVLIVKSWSNKIEHDLGSLNGVGYWVDSTRKTVIDHYYEQKVEHISYILKFELASVFLIIK